MGWSYQYLFLRDLPSSLREKALQDGLFRDLTDVAAKAHAFEKVRESKLREAQARHVPVNEWLALFREKPEDPLVAEFCECDDGVEGELPIYCVLFSQFDGAVIVQYSSAYFDIHGDWTRTAIGLLWKWGCRGEVVMVAANSVCDDADINIFTLDDDRLTVRYIKDESNETDEMLPYERKYTRFRSAPVDLMKLHHALLSQTFPEPFLVLGFRTAELAKDDTPRSRLCREKETFRITQTKERARG